MNQKIILSFGTGSRGNASGVFGYKLEFSNEESPKSLLEQMAEILHKIRTHEFADRYKNAFIVGNAKGEDSENVMMTLLKCLKDLNFKIHFSTTDLLYHSYYVFVDYLQVHITSDSVWAGFQCSEVVYSFDKNKPVDPTLPVSQTLCSLKVVGDDKTSAKAFYDFIKSSKHVWNIYNPTEVTYIEKLID